VLLDRVAESEESPVRKFWIVFVIIAALLGGGLGLLWLAVSSLEAPVPSAEGRVLQWQAGGSYPEVAPENLLERLRFGDRPTFSQLSLALRRAARDPGVETLMLDLRGISVNWAQLEELVAAIATVREQGKQVWAYVESGGNADYALACAADRIAMAPEGNLMVLGVASELAFFAETLDKVGLEAEFLHVGKYKSAPEQLTRTEPTDANREMTTALVEGRYDLLVDLIATGRRRPAETVRQWIDTGLYDAPTALAAGLVDTLLTAEGLMADLAPADDVARLERYALAGGGGSGRRSVALIVAAGTIFPGPSRRDNLQGQILGSDTVIEQLADARQDAGVDAVVLRVDSPGGSALASDLIWREVQRVREVKPVIVSMGGYAASGGYYLACAADSIFAGHGTLTGSIGVFAGKVDWSGLFDKIGVHREFIQRGENALMMSDAGGFTPEQRELFQAQLERFYRRFVAKVAQGRGLEPSQVDQVAQGRVWTGSQARQAGLVDGLGGLNRALVSARAMLGLPPDARLRIKTYGEPLSWLERTMLDALRSRVPGGRLVSEPGPLAGLPEPLASTTRAILRAGLADVAPLLDGRPLALLPWRELEAETGQSR
jgi:protease-4